jgi:hypothetical protein
MKAKLIKESINELFGKKRQEKFEDKYSKSLLPKEGKFSEENMYAAGKASQVDFLCRRNLVVEFKVSEYKRSDTYVAFTWKDKKGNEKYEEIAVQWHEDTVPGIMKSIVNEINYQDKKYYNKTNESIADDMREPHIEVRPYPQMSVEEFNEWFENEIMEPYGYYPEDTPVDDMYDGMNEFDYAMDQIINNEDADDEELISILSRYDVPQELIDKLIPMREYFWDFRYTQHL